MEGLQIVLLGKTGSGKSASGNTIISGNRNTYKVETSPASVTTTCKSAETQVNGQKIKVIDTVGLNDTPATVHVQTEIEEIFKHAPNGIDVFLLVIKFGESLKDKDKNHLTWIQENFGAKVLKSTIILFTHADQLANQQEHLNLKEKVEDYISKSKILHSLVRQCSNRYHVFNNKDQDPSQVTQLLNYINLLRVKNRYSRYTERDYVEAQEELLYSKCYTGAQIGGAVGAAGGAAGGAIALKMGAVALTAGKVAAAGAAGAAGAAFLLGGAVFAGVYLLTRKYYPKNK